MAVLLTGRLIEITPSETTPLDEKTVYDSPQQLIFPLENIAHTLYPGVAIETALSPTE